MGNGRGRENIPPTPVLPCPNLLCSCPSKPWTNACATLGVWGRVCFEVPKPCIRTRRKNSLNIYRLETNQNGRAACTVRVAGRCLTLPHAAISRPRLWTKDLDPRELRSTGASCHSSRPLLQHNADQTGTQTSRVKWRTIHGCTALNTVTGNTWRYVQLHTRQPLRNDPPTLLSDSELAHTAPTKPFPVHVTGYEDSEVMRDSGGRCHSELRLFPSILSSPLAHRKKIGKKIFSTLPLESFQNFNCFCRNHSFFVLALRCHCFA